MNYKQQIIAGLDNLTESQLSRLADSAFAGKERGENYAEGADEVFGILIGAYDIEETIANLEHLNEQGVCHG